MWVNPRQLKPWGKNPRRNDDAVGAVADSIKRFGFGAPIVARQATGEVIGGHTRLKAALKLGLTQVPVRYLDISERDAELLALADNRLGELAEWDNAGLAELLQGFEPAERALAGWDGDDFDELLAEVSGSEPESGDGPDPVFTRERIADAMVEAFFGRHPSEFAPPLWQQMLEINKLAAGSQTHGYHVPDAYYWHRFDTLCGNSPESPLAMLTDRETLRAAIMLALEQDRASTTWTTLSSIFRYRGRQAAAQFDPAVARELYCKHCEPDAVVLDPCAGWGGRLIGWFASGLGGSYHGIDASLATVQSAAEMIAALGIPNARVEHAAFEDVQLEPSAYDFAFTSPPYFAQERYSTDAEQSFVRYGTYLEWRDGFLVPLVRKTYAALRPGSAFVLNIDDVKQGNRTLPLVQDASEAAKAVGFVVEATYTHDFAASGDDNQFGHGSQEPFIVLRKPKL